MVVHHAAGRCPDDIYVHGKGWDVAKSSLDECNKVCLEDKECTYNSFMKDVTCNRYEAKVCNLTVAPEYVTYKKVNMYDEPTLLEETLSG